MEKKEVKERQHMKAPKVSAASRKIPQDMKAGYRKVNEQVTPADERYDSPSDYATQKSEQYTYEVASVAYSGTKKAVNKVKEKVEDKIRDKVEDLENRREQKEAERLEHNQPRTETRTPEQQITEAPQPSSNPSVQSEPRFDTSGHEILPKEKANMLQQRFNQLEPKQSDEPSFRSSRPAPQELTPQQKAEILQKQRIEPKEKAHERQPDGSAPTNYDTATKPQYEYTTQ